MITSNLKSVAIGQGREIFNILNFGYINNCPTSTFDQTIAFQ